MTPAQTITEVGVWRRLTLLPSTDAFLPQTRSFRWLTDCSTSNFFSSENTKLGSMPSSMRFRRCRHFSTLIRSCVGVSSWRFCNLQEKALRFCLRMQRIEVWLIPASATSLVTERRGFVLKFSLMFLTIRLVRTVLILPWLGRLVVWPVSLNFLTTFQTVSRRI